MHCRKDFLSEVMDRNGQVDPDRLARVLGITKDELADEFGLHRDTQARLKDGTRILDQVLPWAGSAPRAFAWYRSQPIPAFDDRTAEDLVKEGRAEAVRTYLHGLAASGHA